MIRIFSKNRKELKTDVDTWIVEWITYKDRLIGREYPKVRECYQAFTNYDEAVEFRDTLNDAMKLLGITSLPNAKIHKQERNSI